MRPLALALVVVTALPALNACKPSSDAPKDAAAPVASEAAAPASASAPPSAPPPKDAAPPPALDAAAAVGDVAPAGACRLLWGPAEMPFHGAAELAIAGDELRVVANEDGKPHIFPIAITPQPKAPVAPPPPPTSFVSARWPTCALAGKWAFCPAKGGAITRTTLGATDTKEISRSHGGTRVAAAALGADHAVVAYLESHKTSEGDMLQAFARLDDGEPVRLSDDGAGANVVRLVPRGDGVTAVYIDQRSAMLPVHARTVKANGNKLALGPDTVLFIGGPPERNVDFALARGTKDPFVLLPMPKDTLTFGVATLPIADPPKPDVEPTWSMYPNGLDPAPIAADGRWVARVRQRSGTGAGFEVTPRVLEVGTMGDGGAFKSFGEVAEEKGGVRFAHVAIAVDAHGALWILHAEGARAWLQRRACP